MPRPPRLSGPDAIHHVLNRCNHQEHLLAPPDCHDLGRLLAETKQRFRLRLFAYALLHNHYHLLAQEQPDGSLSTAMQWFNGTAAARYNLRHGVHGHLWQGRFKNRLITGERPFLQCLVYIDLNPARAGLARRLTDWPFASTRAHVDGVVDSLLDPLPLALSNYRELLLAEWHRTERLRNALQEHDRLAVTQWLHQAPAPVFIPFAHEIAQLLGHNFRRLIPRPPPTAVPKRQALL